MESMGSLTIGTVTKVLRTMTLGTLIFEGAGAIALAFRFIPLFGAAQGLWFSIFHAVSAFCNAGFDLLGTREQFSSLTSYAADPAVNIVIMFLITAGGIGFLTWDDMRANGFRLRRYRMQTKVILCASLCLLVLPALYFFFFEFGGLPFKERLLASLFQSVTPRTAGFNTVDLEAVSEPGWFVIIALMLIGGSPGSTAGGMKTTTVAVLGAAVSLAWFGWQGKRSEGKPPRAIWALLCCQLLLAGLGAGALYLRAYRWIDLAEAGLLAPEWVGRA